jgi:hypothetical protein
MDVEKAALDLVSRLEVGGPAAAGNLALFPLLLKGSAASGGADYLLYEHAQSMSLISIAEVSETGVVGQLLVENRASRPVLVVEGEVLLGMKQTRVLNVSILVPAESRLVIPVSCVEAGRWHPVSGQATGRAAVNLAPSIRAAKTVTVGRSMRSARTFASDQHAVWAGVDDVLDTSDIESPTHSYSDFASQELERLMGISRSIKPASDQIGVIPCIGKQVLCTDIFETPTLLSNLWAGLVTSYLADVADESKSIQNQGMRGRNIATAWFRSIGAGTASVGPRIGLGDHVTVVGRGVEACALVYEGRVLHLSAFPAHNEIRRADFVSPRRRGFS